jgi:hypothetical protein
MNTYFNVTFVTKSGSTQTKRVWAPTAKTAELFIQRTKAKKLDRVLRVEAT